MTPPAQHPPGASTDDRIIEAALGLIAQDGLGAVTMLRVAEAAGVARQTLYNHYPDIDSIVTEAISRHNRESIRLLEDSLRVVDEPADKLEQLVRHVVAVGAHAHHAPGIEQGLSLDARSTLHEYHDALSRCICEILDEGRRRGVFRDDLISDIDTLLIRHMLNGLAGQAAATPESAATLATVGTRTILAAVEVR
jgi:AcrR family transcriptional regulator